MKERKAKTEYKEGDPENCPYCNVSVNYLNYKWHLYMNCTPSKSK